MSDLPTDYNGLLSEYNKLKSEFDEQNTIYEEYITSLENSKKEFEQKLAAANKEAETYKKESNKLREAMQDRNKDIDYLENELQKSKEKMESYKEKINKLESKNVELELENTNVADKIREMECWGEDLKQKLEAALEENIILHTEMDSFKQECDEKIQRIQEELEDNKNEVLCKEKLIEKLTNHRDFLVKTAVKDSEELKHSILHKSQRGNSSSTLNKEKELNDKASHKSEVSASFKQPNLVSKKSSENKQAVSIVNKVPEKFLSQLGNSFINYSLEKQKEKTGDKENEEGDDEDKDFFMIKIQNEVRSILENRKNFLLATLNYESFSFDILNYEGPARLGKIKAAVQINEAIDEVLQKLRERKEKVVMQKRLMQAKFEKLGIKI